MARKRGGGLEKSFLERNNRVIGAIALVIILAGTAVSLLLTGGVFARTYKVTALFRDAAGIQPDDKVRVAGLDAGRVNGVRIHAGIVAIDLGVNRGVELTKDTRAEIVVETLLGKRSVNLISDFPERTLSANGGTELLQDGDTIPLSRTTTPIDIVELNDISTRLAQESDPVALNEFLKDLSQITAGKRQEVRRLLTGLRDVLRAVDSRKEQLSRLISSLRVLFTTLGERRENLVSFIDSFRTVFNRLSLRQRELATLLEATDLASHETANLVARNRPVLDSTLNNLRVVMETLGRHQLDLAATISYLEDSVQGYQSVARQGSDCGYENSFNCDPGTPVPWANIFVQSLGPLGVDALIGQCGVVDQLFDQIIGVGPGDPGGCATSTPPPPVSSSATSGPSISGGAPVPPIQLPPVPQLPLPPGVSIPPLPPGSGVVPGGGINLPASTSGIQANRFAPMPNHVGDLIISALYGWDEKAP
ncbi:MAG: MCE family protein [Actinomycetota bacterium]|nr:MCE family protein [Actinomycetota bacterium]